MKARYRDYYTPLEFADSRHVYIESRIQIPVMKTQNSAPLYACFSHLVLPMSFGIYYDPKKVNYGS